MSDRVIVAMDGSTHVSTAALLGRGPGDGLSARWRVLAARTHTDSRGQARVLLRLLDDMLQEIGRSPEDIGAVVAGIGPGTFTGVRIAVATARALALALDVPVIGISTLSALAAQVATEREPGGVEGDALQSIVPVVDARRGQVFYGVYRRAEDGRFARSEAFGVVDRDALLSVIPAGPGTLVAGDIAVLGDQAGLGEASLLAREVRAEDLVMGQGLLDEPGDGAEGARLGGWLTGVLGTPVAGLKAGDPGTPEGVKPIYVRSPDADIHITKMRDPWAEAAQDR
jgi:tRNA threonylcarbamoyl adenosine modification protein YeaZ